MTPGKASWRIIETIMDMKKIFGERRAAVVKEITKIHEQVFRGTIPEILKIIEKTKIAGEYVIIVEGYVQTDKLPDEIILSEVRSLMKKGLSRKEAVKKIAAEYRLSKKELYDKSLNETLDFFRS